MNVKHQVTALVSLFLSIVLFGFSLSVIFPTHKIYEITLGDEIKDQDPIVKEAIKVLQHANSGDTVIFHISGYGGDLQTAIWLINNIKITKAHTIMSVEGPSYSAHAYIAASGNELKIAPYTYLMFHTSSGYGIDCSVQTGTDRTVSNVEHCEAMLKYHLGLTNQYIDSISFLTPAEKDRIETGHDVYITSGDYYARQSHK